MIMNLYILYGGAACLTTLGFISLGLKNDSLANSLIAGGLVLLWLGTATLCAH